MSRTSLFSATFILAFTAGGLAFASPTSMTPEEARHLISRTGFGATPQEIKAFTGLSYADGVSEILENLSTEPQLPMPAWVNAPDYPADYIWVLGQTEEELFFSNRWLEIEELSGWWFSEMMATPSPMTERLTLFWHDHFSTSYDAVENPQWLARQNQFFRRNAAGNFADLARGILKDPAMLTYLSNTENFADSPNENLGREFLELFTLGEGRGYTQADVEAAAHILTGHSIADLSLPVYTFYPENHDFGEKTLFGQTGEFEVSDLVDMTLTHPDFGSFIVEKLWRTFISDQPDPAEVAHLTKIWRDNDLEMKPLLEAILLSDAFWDSENRGRLVKSPVELVVGTLRSLGIPIENSTDLAWLTSDMGQTLFFPPNVGGWPEGVDWVNDANATARATALNYFAFEDHDATLAAQGMMAPMMAPREGSVSVAPAGPDDFRVGQIFTTDLEKDEGWLGGMFVLYDVSFGGQTFRSIPIWVEENTTEDYAGYSIVRTDCLPTCFANIDDGDEDDWIWYGPWEGALEDDLVGASKYDIELLQAIAAHLPKLIASTDSQVSWRPDPGAPEEEYQVPTTSEMVAMANSLAKESADAIGQTHSTLIRGASAPGLLGLQGYAEIGDGEEMDAYLENSEQQRIIPAIPPVTYFDARDWLNDLPQDGLESRRAAAALLSVPRQTQGLRDEMVASDPEALVRALILSPEFQVN